VILSTAVHGVQGVILLGAAVAAPEDVSTSFWGLFLVTAITLVFQCYRESRDRKWKKEDAEEKAQIAHLVVENKRLTSEVQRAAAKDAAAIITELGKNTVLTQQVLDVQNGQTIARSTHE
jgi:hypothetical protein